MLTEAPSILEDLPSRASKAQGRKRAARSGTFIDNMRLPVHRWFRYSAGFSAEWVRQVLLDEGMGAGDLVLDPFAGSGTTLVAAQAAGVPSVGYESHPFVQRVAEAKLAWASDIPRFQAFARDVRTTAEAAMRSSRRAPHELLRKCYSDDALDGLLALRDAYRRLEASAPEPAARLVWLAITGILRMCSGVGTAQWQYLLPNKSKARVIAPMPAFDLKIAEMVGDMQHAQAGRSASASVLPHDARARSLPIEAGSVSLVITSPPYANNYDYADATRLEMVFWEEISGWGDLQSVVRRHIVRSCSQHATADRIELDPLLAQPEIAPIRDELAAVCRQLDEIRHTKGGKKAYHLMVAAYFADMALVFNGLRNACRDGSRVCFVVGDSAPYGIYVPVERWLGDLAVANGFKSYSFNKLRDRNTKWKNRKHTVPLHEGHLWIEG